MSAATATTRAEAPRRAEALAIRGVSKRFGATVALDDVHLELPAGGLTCFLGPSGCGKTTLLRLIAGLETPSSGRILLGGRDLSAVPAHRRGIGMVFQSYALFPHLSVAENVAYGLRVRGVGARERRRRADELLALVRLEGLGDRPVGRLSGGQRQRVAMARALALEPALFLLDEPLSALDAKLRSAMQVEIKQLQRRLGVSTVLVTHDQEEAMTMADLVVVMGEGRVQQVGPPLEVYHRPVNRFVADFIGSNNFVPATALSKGVRALGVTLPLTLPAGTREGDAVTLSVRPEKLELFAAPPPSGAPQGRVSFVRDLGQRTETYVEVAGVQLIAVSPLEFPVGAPVWVRLPPESCTVFAA
ncbi:ABC transporter ATP-binding protein [Truepera radiovictrix]|uniref:ABC transporter related protein n=1 Tax=Truepera radiovictrix (strain DSM 17093 / CIP 108686 / LMG 22925 / RQ-24) TaxID=649638 RepID=D7CX30_TRURR|nr:ABC transporter ATP-binding protein [Truepera radiovictrix]ADI14538.1 ABC transporter related protein [Truepera radiovictrix DSM 17093]WMT56911.1 ABC transporter ATP-binding protein [Truepera radiovictrix]